MKKDIVIHGGGLVTYPDGSVGLGDQNRYYPDGKILQPDGTADQVPPDLLEWMLFDPFAGAEGKDSLVPRKIYRILILNELHHAALKASCH